MKKLIALTFLLITPALLFAQQKSTSKKTTAPPPTIKGCHLPADSIADNTLSLEDIKSWADSKPLNVRCGNVTYSLHQFTISIIKQNPMQTLDFGTGNAGIPILARRAIDQMGPLETILLREVIAKDAAGKEVKLSNIVFKVEPAPKNTEGVKTEEKTTAPETPKN